MYFPIIDVLKENFIAKIPSIVTQWLTDNVDPVGSAVVVDKSLSISGAAADAKITGDEISDLKSDLTNILVIYSTDWEQGGVSATAGTVITSTTRIRTQFIDESILAIEADDGYSYLILAYSGVDTYVGAWNGTEWVKSTSGIWQNGLTNISDHNDGYRLKFVLKKNDESDIVPSESTHAKLYIATDKALTQHDKAADAYETGKRIAYNANMSDSIIAVASGMVDEQIINEITDISTFEIGAINSSGEAIVNNTSYRTDFIPATYGEKVKSEVSLIGETSSRPYHWVFFYNKNKEFISRYGGRIDSGYATINISLPNETKYIRISLTYVEINNVNNYLLQTYLKSAYKKSPINKWYVLGDSISAGYYSMTQSMAEADGVTMTYVSPVTTDGGETTGSVWDSTLSHNYWGYMNEWYLGRELIGKAYPGQGYYRTASNSQNGIYVVDNNDFSDAGLITVAWGFNDWHYDQPRGNHNLIDSSVPYPTENYDTTQLTTVNHAIWYCLGRLIQKAPKAKIVVQTPMNGWAYGGDFSTNWSIGYAKSDSGTLADIHDDIKYWADYYGLQVLDMTYNNSVVNRLNIKTTIIDGSHPSDDAHKQLARSVWTKLGY